MAPARKPADEAQRFAAIMEMVKAWNSLLKSAERAADPQLRELFAAYERARNRVWLESNDKVLNRLGINPEEGEDGQASDNNSAMEGRSQV